MISVDEGTAARHGAEAHHLAMLLDGRSGHKDEPARRQGLRLASTTGLLLLLLHSFGRRVPP